MAVSDRIAVMNYGEVQQVGSPRELYQHPENLFVATFIGKTNILDAELIFENNKSSLILQSGQKIDLNNTINGFRKEQNVRVSIRPEEFVINDESGLDAVIESAVFLGLNTHYTVHLKSGEQIEVIMESTISNSIEMGKKIKLRVKEDRINIFDSTGKINLQNNKSDKVS